MCQPWTAKSQEANTLSDKLQICIYVAAAAAMLEGGQGTATKGDSEACKSMSKSTGVERKE